MEFFLWKNFITLQKTSKILILISLTLIFLLIIIPLNNYQYPSYVTYILNHYNQVHDHKYCNIFTGEWIPNPDAPYYTNNTCIAIHEHQNCMKYGRPDTEFLKWRWKPKRCELPIFNPNEFLDMMRNKSLAFVGDSVGRNQMQSLICLLSQVEHPIDISPTPDFNFKKWKYTTYNFTLATYWSPFLVKMEEADSDGPRHDGVFNIYLDEVDKKWTSQINDFNYIILNSGHWFSRLSVYYEKNQLIGCWHCGLKNITQLPNYYGYKRVFRTALKAINSLDNFKGTTFVRTFAPSHFEGGEWNTGGNCLRKIPFTSNEKTLDGLDLEFYNSQVEEFREAKKKGKKRFILMDITQAMLLRPDGHPSRYGHWPNENVVLYNDCVHWCLPGPIDSWNDFLLHMLKMEQDII